MRATDLSRCSTCNEIGSVGKLELFLGGLRKFAVCLFVTLLTVQVAHAPPTENGSRIAEPPGNPLAANDANYSDEGNDVRCCGCGTN